MCLGCRFGEDADDVHARTSRFTQEQLAEKLAARVAAGFDPYAEGSPWAWQCTIRRRRGKPERAMTPNLHALYRRKWDRETSVKREVLEMRIANDARDEAWANSWCTLV